MLSTPSSNNHHLYHLNVHFVSHLRVHYTSRPALFHVTIEAVRDIYESRTICTLYMLSTLSSIKHNLYHLDVHFVSHLNTNCASRTASRTASTNRELHVHLCVTNCIVWQSQPLSSTCILCITSKYKLHITNCMFWCHELHRLMSRTASFNVTNCIM